MFKRVEISAPGKLILCGEHAVVYGRKAIAAAINSRTHLIATSTTDNDTRNEFILNLNDISQTITINQASFKSIQQSITSNDLQEILNHVLNSSSNESKHYKAIIFMLLSNRGINWDIFCNLTVNVSSEIPLGSGLGSSASFSVCISAFLLILSGKVLLKNEWSEHELELINSHAFCLEKIFHGKASGIDNTVATFGDYILFEKGEIVKFSSNQKLPLLVVNSGMPKNTMEQVLKVRSLYEKQTEICEHIFDAIDKIVIDFLRILRHNEANVAIASDVQDLITMNHGLLCALQVSNLGLNTIVGLAEQCGFAGKLTGSGGGGCCLILLRSNEDSMQMIEKLDEMRFEHFEVANLGSPGVRVDDVVI